MRIFIFPRGRSCNLDWETLVYTQTTERSPAESRDDDARGFLWSVCWSMYLQSMSDSPKHLSLAKFPLPAFVWEQLLDSGRGALGKCFGGGICTGRRYLGAVPKPQYGFLGRLQVWSTWYFPTSTTGRFFVDFLSLSSSRYWACFQTDNQNLPIMQHVQLLNIVSWVPLLFRVAPLRTSSRAIVILINLPNVKE